MAYDSKGLSALSYANGFTLWHYRTADSLMDVVEAGYFNGAARMLRRGDMIMVNASVGLTDARSNIAVVREAGELIEIAYISMGA